MNIISALFSLIVLAVLAIGLYLVIACFSQFHCSSLYDAKRKPEWGVFTGCTILVNNERIPDKNFRLGND